MSKFEFIHTLYESKSIFEIEQNAIVSWFVKNVAFLLGHRYEMLLTYDLRIRNSDPRFHLVSCYKKHF